MKSRASKAGFLAGADVTTRGVIDAGDGAIVGVLTGYVDTQIDLEAQAIAARILGGSSTRLHGTLSGPSAGAYAVYFDGAFSADLALRADALTLSEQVNEILITTVPSVATVIAANSVGLLTDTVAANVNYRLRPAPGYWVEPTIGAQVVGLNYGSNAADLGLQDGRQITAQAGARLGAEARLDARTRVTTTLTGLAYDDVSITGGFTPDFAFLGRNILAQADEGRLRGRGVVNVNFDFDERISTFAQAEVRGGAHLFGVGGKAGVRWIW